MIVGWACTGIQVAALPAITSTYAIDSYKPVSAYIFVSVTVNKNLWGYGFSKFHRPAGHWKGVPTAYHDKHEFDSDVVSLLNHLLVLWEEIQGLN